MSAMDKLIFGQLEKLLPADSKHYASPDGIKSLGEKIGSFVDFFRRGILISVQQNDAILKNQQEIMTVLNIEDKYVGGPKLSNGSDVQSGGGTSSNSGGNSLAA